MSWNSVQVGSVLRRVQRKNKVKVSQYMDAGAFPVIDKGEGFIAGYTNDEACIHSELPVILFGDHTRVLKYIDFPFAQGADGTQLLLPDSRFDPRYFFYALKDLKLKNYGYERHFKYLKGETIPQPSIDVQRKTSRILGSYDDLIEVNRKRILSLEKMAKLTYDEWFSEFRFPGHGKAKMVDSELGEIPEGWSVMKLGDLGETVTGKTPSTRDIQNFGSEVPFVKTPDMHGNMFCIDTEQMLSEKGAKSQETKTLPPNTVMVSCIGTIGVVSISYAYCQTNQQINSIKIREPFYREYLYFVCKNLKSALENLGGSGATMGNVNKEKFQSIKVIVPRKELLVRFSGITSPIFDEVKYLQLENRNLASTRDVLLPKLISGEIDVSNSDLRTSEAET